MKARRRGEEGKRNWRRQEAMGRGHGKRRDGEQKREGGGKVGVKRSERNEHRGEGRSERRKGPKMKWNGRGRRLVGAVDGSGRWKGRKWTAAVAAE